MHPLCAHGGSDHTISSSYIYCAKQHTAERSTQHRCSSMVCGVESMLMFCAYYYAVCGGSVGRMYLYDSGGVESSVPLGITRYRGPSGVASLHREKDIYIHNICLCVSQCMCVHAFLCGDGPHQTHCRDRSHITPRHAFTHTYTGKAHRNAKKTPFRSTTHTHTQRQQQQHRRTRDEKHGICHVWGYAYIHACQTQPHKVPMCML